MLSIGNSIKMILNPRYISLLAERKRHDWSYLPVVFWYRAFLSLLRFIELRYIRRERKRSFYALLGAQNFLLKVRSHNPSVLKLKKAVAKTLGQELSNKGSEYFGLPGNGKRFEQNIEFIKKRMGIVLKTPRFVGERVMEKGVLLLTHSIGFQFFSYCTDVYSVLEHYALILEPGWAGDTDPDVLYFTKFKDYPIIVMTPEKRDYDFLKAIGTNLIPVSLGPSDWINPSIFHLLKDQEKRYDAVMVASWLKLKRHHILFRALYELRDPSFQVALVSILPDHREEIELLVNAYGVRDNVTFFEQLPQEEVNRIFNQSKVNLLLSLQEGGNRALFEGFFAGVPGLALENTIGISKDYFTRQTGRLIKEKNLRSELLYFREHWNEFNPRPWAEANITPEIATVKLNALLKNLAHQRGEEWTKNVVAKCNAPNLEYYPEGSVGRGMPSYEDILGQYSL
jgi:glycosyltransferase involved in cell wall biosynthesis